MNVLERAETRLDELCGDYTFGKPDHLDILEHAVKVCREFKADGVSLGIVPTYQDGDLYNVVFVELAN